MKMISFQLPSTLLKVANKTMSPLGLAAILVLLLGVVWWFYKQSSASKPYITENYTGSSDVAEVVLFYADWCPHCQKAKPIWYDVKNQYQNKQIHGKKIQFTEIDCTQESDEVDRVIEQYGGVKGYPTIKLFQNGETIDFEKTPTQESLTAFLNAHL
jgi:thiol-disulfide isomerase/thioredoxin